MEVTIDNLEDMCALMCDNRIPKRKNNDRRRVKDRSEEAGVQTDKESELPMHMLHAVPE